MCGVYDHSDPGLWAPLAATRPQVVHMASKKNAVVIPDRLRLYLNPQCAVQLEVGDRILAAPGSKTYGRLSVMAQAASQPSLGFHLPARAFTPPPKVASSVLVFDDCDHDALTLKALERVTAAAFAQRRKMIRTTLKPVFGEDMEQVFEALGLEPTQRAETISVKTFLDLAEAFRQRTGGEVS